MIDESFSKKIADEKDQTSKAATEDPATDLGNQKIVPELRVSGNWLAEHGFKPGVQVEITVRQNELVIKPLS